MRTLLFLLVDNPDDHITTKKSQSHKKGRQFLRALHTHGSIVTCAESTRFNKVLRDLIELSRWLYTADCILFI